MSQRPGQPADDIFLGESDRNRLPSTIFEVGSEHAGTTLGSFRGSADYLNVASRSGSGVGPRVDEEEDEAEGATSDRHDTHSNHNSMDTSEIRVQHVHASPPPKETVDLNDERRKFEENSVNPAKKRRAARLPWYAILFGWDRKGDMSVRTYMVHPESPFVAVIHYVQCFLLLYSRPSFQQS